MLIFKVERRDGSSLEMRLNDCITWPEAIDELVCFLRGAGYIIPNELEVNLEVPEEKDEQSEKEEEE
jgi:hypothetical protein